MQKDHGHHHQLDLTVIVGGEDVHVHVKEDAPLQTLLEKALAESGNEGQPLERWHLFNASGVALTDLGARIGALGIVSGMTLSMSLAAGVGG